MKKMKNNAMWNFSHSFPIIEVRKKLAITFELHKEEAIKPNHS